MDRRSRRLPFLQRNWVAATNPPNKSLGVRPSRPHHDLDNAYDSNEDEVHRPKRRRIVDNDASGDYDGLALLDDPSDMQRAVRIEVLKVVHKDAPRVKFNGILNGVVAPSIRDVSEIKARVKITLSTELAGEQEILHVDSQTCTIKISKNPVGMHSMARFYAKPFHIPEDKILVQRDDDDIYSMADSYTLVVELQSAASSDPNWPPIELSTIVDEDAFSSRGTPPRQWVFTATNADIFSSRSRKGMRLKLKKHPQTELLTNFIMDIDVRWCMPLSNQAMTKRMEKDVLPSITVIDRHLLGQPVINGDASSAVNGNGINGGVNGGDVNGHIDGHINGTHETNGINGFASGSHLVNGDSESVNGHANGVLDHMEDLADGELTPNRSRRARQEINYNVRQMWNTAVGKENRKRRKPDDKEPDYQGITYLFPPEQLHVDSLTCLYCGAVNQTVTQLRAHYLSHPQYEFHYEARPRGCYVTVTHNPVDPGSPIRPQVYQLGLPLKPLDLEKYVDGDDSWITSRLGPDNDVEQPPRMLHTRAPKTTTTHNKRGGQASRKVIVVPNIKQPLYDLLSKATLVPGTKVPPHKVDETWLIQKHRDTLQDFLDVFVSEKEYMAEWDAFALEKHLSSEQYLPRLFITFVKQKAAWIAAKQSRTEEFAKHASFLLARKAIPDTLFLEASLKINETRIANPEPQPEPESPRPTDVCGECGNPVAVSSLLICENKKCKKRMFHDACVGQDGYNKEKPWRCNGCLYKAKVARTNRG